jgi:hypothetical protein
MNALSLALLSSVHFGTPELNGVHPVIEYGNAMYYKNSFGRHAIAGFTKLELFNNFTLRLGLTTGYDKIMSKGDYLYEIPFALGNNLALFVVPSYDIEIARNISVTTAILGNAIAAGLKIEFK